MGWLFPCLQAPSNHRRHRCPDAQRGTGPGESQKLGLGSSAAQRNMPKLQAYKKTLAACGKTTQIEASRSRLLLSLTLDFRRLREVDIERSRLAPPGPWCVLLDSSSASKASPIAIGLSRYGREKGMMDAKSAIRVASRNYLKSQAGTTLGRYVLLHDKS